jgi:hypothetical protein
MVNDLIFALLNPLFFAALFGTGAACLLLAVLSLVMFHGSGALYRVIGSTLYGDGGGQCAPKRGPGGGPGRRFGRRRPLGRVPPRLESLEPRTDCGGLRGRDDVHDRALQLSACGPCFGGDTRSRWEASAERDQEPW